MGNSNLEALTNLSTISFEVIIHGICCHCRGNAATRLQVYLVPASKQVLEQVLRVNVLDPRVAEGLSSIFLIFVCAWAAQPFTLGLLRFRAS